MWFTKIDEQAEGVVVSNTSSIDWPSPHFRLTSSLWMGVSEWWVGDFWALSVVMNLDLCTIANFAHGIWRTGLPVRPA